MLEINADNIARMQALGYRTGPELARAFRCSRRTIGRRMRALGLDLRPKAPQLDRAALEAARAAGATLLHLARSLGVSRATLTRRMRELGLPTTYQGPRHVELVHNIDPQALLAARAMGWTVDQIAALFKVSRSTIKRRFVHLRKIGARPPTKDDEIVGVLARALAARWSPTPGHGGASARTPNASCSWRERSGDARGADID